MGSYLVQVTLQHTDAAESTDAVNTFHFRKRTVTDNFTFIQEMVEDFYTRNDADPTNTVSAFLSPRIRRDVPALVKIYDDNAPDIGGPIHTGSFPLTAPLSNVALPEEVAVCASFHAEPVLGLRKSSTSGRVFIGPLNDAAQTPSSGGRPDGAIIQALIAAMQELHDASSNAVDEHRWSIYSRTADERLDWDGPTEFPVIGGFVDNAFDTQRRRGLDPSTRSTWGT